MIKELPKAEASRSKTVDPGTSKRPKKKIALKATDYESSKDNAGLPTLASMKATPAGRKRSPQMKAKLIPRTMIGSLNYADPSLADRVDRTESMKTSYQTEPRRFGSETQLF